MSSGPELPELEDGDGAGTGAVKTMVVTVDGREIRLIEMSQMPIMRVIPIMAETDPTRQVMMLIDLLRSAVMNPKDWDRTLSKMSMEELQGVIQKWTATLEVAEIRQEPKRRKWFGKKKR